MGCNAGPAGQTRKLTGAIGQPVRAMVARTATARGAPRRHAASPATERYVLSDIADTATLHSTSTEPTEPSEAPTFRDLGVIPAIADALEAEGVVTPFAIQALALPLALAGSDLIGQARTGTGKTFAFGIPLLQRLVDAAQRTGKPAALVVVPTRELCVQVAGDLTRAGKGLDVRILAIYGGRSYEPQIAALDSGIDVVVGTPGRLLDLARQRHLDLSHVQTLVLDEADEMLDLGFLPDVEAIVALTPAATRQTMLFSATMPGPIVTLARRYLSRPVNVRAESPEENATVPTTQQHVFRAHALDKIEMLARILQAENRGLVMVFARTKRTVAKIADDLNERGFAAGAVHGDLGQGQREQALRAFRTGKVDVLVATDVAARGIDVTGVTHVINYQCPEDEKTYLHRIGRTGRAGGSGTAVTFVDWDDVPRWTLINTALALPFPDPPETYSTSAHLYEALDIPAGVGATLPRAKRTRAGLAAESIEDLGETGKSRSRPPRDTGPAAKRPSRQRQRTRGGQPSAADSTPAKTGESGDPARPPRRRRRGGRGRPGGSAEAAG
jgi:superfamily II DNA/RNA helicase